MSLSGVFRAAFFVFLISAPAMIHAESVSLRSEDARWIAGMIFKNECDLNTDCLLHWNEGEDFPSLGIGHFIWYPAGNKDRYRESFPGLIQYLQDQGVVLTPSLEALFKGGAPWKTREDFLERQDESDAILIRNFLRETMDGQALFMIRRLQKSVMDILQIVDADDREVIAEKVIALTQTRNGLYAMIDYLNFKGDGLSPDERYHTHGWGLFQVLKTMGWPAGSAGPEAEFVGAARSVLRRRVDNAPLERQEDRWIQGWVKRVETYSTDAQPLLRFHQNANPVALKNAPETIEVLNMRDLRT